MIVTTIKPCFPSAWICALSWHPWNPEEPLPCPFTQLRETFKQVFTAMLVDLISEGFESALGDLPEDICWIVHLTSATNGGWPIYELPRPTVGSHQAQYCQIPSADSAWIGDAQPSAAGWGIDKSLCHHSSHKVRIEKESSRLWIFFCYLSSVLSSDAGIDDDIGNRLK